VWPHLLAASAAADRAAAQNGDLGTLQAWRPGSGVHGSGSGDVLLGAVIRHQGPGGVNPYAAVAASVTDTVGWLAQTVLASVPASTEAAIVQLLDATLSPPAAAHIARWVDDADRKARRALVVGDDRRLVPVLGCPHCNSTGSLAVRTSAPPPARTIVCTAGCTCDGPGCGCGMPTEEQGVAHIWTPAQLEATAPRPEAAAEP
jgi:hypothetical protein